MIWDIVAKIYDAATNVTNGKANRKVSEIVAEQIKTTDNVLECACGTGLLTHRIYPLCQTIVATDFSSAMLLQTKKKCSQATNLRLEKADITQLPYATGSFDKVIAGNVLHLLPDPKKAMEEMKRVCRPRGEIIIPTYVKPENKNLLTRSWMNLLKVVGVKFKNSFTFSTYQAFFRTLGYTEVRYLIVDGRPPCAIAFVKR